MKKKIDKLAELLFIVSAVICVLALLLIMIFIFYKGSPSILRIGIFKFLFGVEWQLRAEVFSILPMITASVFVMTGAILIGSTLGVLTSTFIVYIAPKKIGNILKIATDVLASIPSVIYGFFGLMIVIPLIDRFLAGGAGGNCMLAAIIILSDQKRLNKLSELLLY